MLISTSNASAFLALFNDKGAINNKPQVGTDVVERAPQASLASPPAALNDHSNLPRIKRSAPLLSRRVEQPTTDRPPVVHYKQDAVMKKIKEHFREYATGENDRFVNVNELKEAAGQVPTTRTFSAEATLYAKILLQNPRALRELDIGIGDYGRPGAEDGRFDIENIDHMLTKPIFLGRHHIVLLRYQPN
ncbi:hypothetical protein YA0721_18665 [Pseudomonas carnis]|uniref:hypothetical protein n=1 Tax=Pseudomonas carnis TaxID=2487355 RepID=UPI0018E6396D|nr:hypothetical protein [Pseudomonas carnis]MBI6656040.1 hypothetical protein [Pseudomonas carnis]MBI6663089.1 hypothetical protein [Pseudomonas carnis]MBI6685815.1 hypothetical protein [Pseudomonas carnis]